MQFPTAFETIPISNALSMAKDISKESRYLHFIDANVAQAAEVVDACFSVGDRIFPTSASSAYEI